MLTLLIKNDKKGTNENASYDYEVRVNFTTIAKGHIDGHNRDYGWAVLIKAIAEQFIADGNTIDGNIKI